MKKFLFLILALVSLNESKAQVPTCGANVPFFQVDLTGQPSGVWVSPWHTRVGQCCSVNNSNNCTSFEVILDANAAMINFEIAGGAIPSGSMFYQINCGPQIAVGSPICITGAGPHHITFCKPGNNENIYRITSIPKPTFPTDDTVRIGCVSNLEVLGLETNSITWQSVFPGTLGQYNSYLSCTSNCATPTYTPAITAPAFVDYKICGFPIADECGFVGVCDTIRIYNFGSMSGIVTPATGTFCAGGSGVSLTASASGGDGDYTFIWRDPNNNIVGNAANYQATIAGTFSVEIRDGLYDPNLCPPIFLSVPVIQVLPPVVNAGTDQTHCADNPTSVLNATIANCTNVVWSGGNGNYNPSNTGTTVIYTPTPAEILAGSVTLTATSIGAGGGCAESTDQINLIFPPDISVNITTSSISCYGNNTTINATVTGGAGAIDYQWNTGAITSSISVTAGNYCVNVEDAFGCYATSCSNVITPNPMTISLSSTDATAGNNGTATAIVTGGTLPYSYTWYTVPVQTIQTATGLGTGMYTVVVTDANGCSISSSVIVNNAFCSGLQATASAKNISCYGDDNGTGVVSASGGTPNYTYSWQPPLSGTNDSISGLSAGTYLVLVTDQNGCVDAATITIIEPLQLENVMNHVDVSVAGGSDGSAVSNVSGGTIPYNYLWSTNGTSSSVSGLSSGVYSIKITDANGCIKMDSVLINEPNCTDFIIGVSSTPVSCNNGSDGSASVVVLNGDSPFTYTWSNGGSSTSINGITSGTYVINVEDAIGCNTFQSITITQPSPLSVTLAATQPSCANVNNGNIELIVTGGTYPFSFNWSNGAQSEDLFGIAPGNYSVNITDDNGCTNSQNTNISYPAAMTSSVSLTNVTCHDGNDGMINLTASGGTGALSYLWSNGATTQDISGLSSALYTVTISDQNGCNNSVPISIFINEPEDVVNAFTTFDCPVPGSGLSLVTVHPSGGSLSNYQVSFDNGNTFQVEGDYDTFLATGNSYSIIILDSNACVSPIADVITINPELTASVIQFEKCYSVGDSLTLVTVTPQGGYTPDYLISFDNGANYLSLGDYEDSLVIANSYQMIVQDTAGCLSIAYTIDIPDAFSLSDSLTTFTANNISCIGMNDGSIDVTVSGGTSPYTYLWSNSETIEDISTLIAGNYSLTVTDSNGCVISDSFTLTEPDSLLSNLMITSDFNGYDVSCFASSDGTVDATTTGGSLPYSYAWSNGDTSEDISNLASGTYNVIITDNNGCQFTDEITLNKPDSISTSDVVENVLCNGFFDGTIDLSVIGGVNPYTFVWSNGDLTEDISNLGPGVFTATITDNNGCTHVHASSIIELNPIVVSTSVSNVLCNNDSNGSIDLTVSGGTIPYVFLWSDSTTNEDIWDLTTGNYAVLITDANGCTYDDTIEVSQPDSLLAIANSPILSNGHNTSFYEGNDGTIDVTVTGGTQPYIYDWSNGANTEDLSALTAGNYTLTVTDSNGCSYTLSIVLDEPYDLQLPQGFSPNSDDKNDLFHILGLEAYPLNLVTVFNRWGNEVFQASDYTNDWDGTYTKTGEKLPDGTYFVILEITTPVEISLKGYVEIRK